MMIKWKRLRRLKAFDSYIMYIFILLFMFNKLLDVEFELLIWCTFESLKVIKVFFYTGLNFEFIMAFVDTEPFCCRLKTI